MNFIVLLLMRTFLSPMIQCNLLLEARERLQHAFITISITLIYLFAGQHQEGSQSIRYVFNGYYCEQRFGICFIVGNGITHFHSSIFSSSSFYFSTERLTSVKAGLVVRNYSMCIRNCSEQYLLRQAFANLALVLFKIFKNVQLMFKILKFKYSVNSACLCL